MEAQPTASEAKVTKQAKSSGNNLIFLGIAVLIVLIAGFYLLIGSGNSAKTSASTTILPSTISKVTTTPTTVDTAQSTTSILTTSIANVSTNCTAVFGYRCSSPINLGYNGNFSFMFGQFTGNTIYNVALACSEASRTSSLPDPNSAMVLISSNGDASSQVAGGNATLGSSELSVASGSTQEIYNLKCFDGASSPITTFGFGSTFSGYLYVNYTLSSKVPGGGNTWYTQRFASLNVN
jgi:hypothetical protein